MGFKNCFICKRRILFVHLQRTAGLQKSWTVIREACMDFGNPIEEDSIVCAACVVNLETQYLRTGQASVQRIMDNISKRRTGAVQNVDSNYETSLFYLILLF